MQVLIEQLLNLPDIQVLNAGITEHEIKVTTHNSHYTISSRANIYRYNERA